MRKLTIEETQERALRILDDISVIFERHKIPWFLAMGTLLGAVRHKGFIPWDDDADIWVPIKHYRKACYLIEKNSKYEIYNFWGDNDYCFENSKVYDSGTIMEDSTRLGEIYKFKRGVGVDIFPLFGCDDYHGIRRMTVKLTYAMVGAHYVCHYQNGGFRGSMKTRMAYKLDKAFDHNMYFWKIRLLKLLHSGKGKKKVGDLFEEHDVYRAEDFKSTVMLDFEGRRFPAPIGYQNVLAARYGDYMQMPPLDKRVAHPGKLFYINESTLGK